MTTYLNYIDGQWVRALSGATFVRSNPANGERVAELQDSGSEDVAKAVSAAVRAKAGWRALSGAARGDFLFKAAQALEARLEEIAETMTREMGKTLAEAKGETARGVAILRYYAGEGMRKIGDVIPSSDAEAFMYTTRVPLGVVSAITPWNFPVAIPVWKLAPALVYGNTVVLKPSELASATAAKLTECFAEAGFPAGVVNLVTGSAAGPFLVEHPSVDGVTFTGSNRIGKRIGAAVLARGGKYQLEMGGKNPIIVAEDADLDTAAEATVSGAFRSTGQKCTATSLAYVHRDVYDAFKERLIERIGRIKVGDGLLPDTWMGPCASEAQYRGVREYIRSGVEEGAALLCGSVPPENAAGSYFVEPTVFEGVTPEMRIAREEIFGPVLALIKVDDVREAIGLANDSSYGLSASLFSKDVSNVFKFIDGLEAGLIRVNSETAGVELQAPFGGMKQSSSHSREQGQAAIEFFTSVKTVFIKP